MTTLPYADLLAQVEALAGASLATPEQARAKIFANRRARKAHRECDYWPHLLYVGEERIVSDTGLLPIEQTGLQDIDKIIRIHAEDPFKSQAVYEYSEYYEDVNGIQITGYQLNEWPRSSYTVTGAINPNLAGFYEYSYSDSIGNDYYSNSANSTFELIGSYSLSEEEINRWLIIDSNFAGWQSELGVSTPDAATSWANLGGSAGTPVFERIPIYSAFITYLAKIPATYGDGEGEESDVPEPWFEYMAQGAYCDWLRSDGQTEKAMAEEVIAESLLNQQLEKVSRSNGNQVITRMMSHGTKQSR